MRKILLISILLIGLIAFSAPVYAQGVSEILGTQTEQQAVDVLNAQETAREAEFTTQLSLKIPAQTDNPSTIITFTDPSAQKSGVQLELDSTSYIEIESPYTLPALSIGSHTLKFKFVDKDGSTQILEKELVVIPRAPIISSPIKQDNQLVITGTGLANSELILFLSNGRTLISKNALIDGDSKWTINIDTKDLTESVFTISAYTRKYGYASNLAESVTFELGNHANTINTIGDTDGFNIKDLTFSDVTNFVTENKFYFITGGTAFVLGIFAAWIISSIYLKKKEDKTVAVLSKKVIVEKDGKTEMTLKERLTQTQPAVEKVVEEKKTEEIKPITPEKNFTKMDFLRDFRKFDPDNDKGKENKVKENDLPVTLTSKKE